MFHTCEEVGISWNLWPWKKLGTTTSPVSALVPDGWDGFVAHAEGRGPALGHDRVRDLLDRFLRAVRLEHCEPQPRVIDALPIEGDPS